MKCLLLIGGCLIPAFNFAQISPNHLLRGLVLHDISSTPIAGTSVTILGASSTLTDDNGIFTLDITKVYRKGKDIRLIVNHPEFELKSNVLYRISDTGTDDATLYLTKSNKLGVIGTIRDEETKTFLKGIRVGISSQKIPGGVTINSVETNEFGEFRIFINKSILTGPVDYLDVLMTDPRHKYRDQRKTVSILAPLELFMEKGGPSDIQMLKVRGDTTIYLDVTPGSLIIIKASGSMRVGRIIGSSSPAGKEDGFWGMGLEGYNLPGAKELNHAALIYQLPGEADWHYCGASCKFVTQGEGRLPLRLEVNDNQKNDNEGAYEVEITVD